MDQSEFIKVSRFQSIKTKIILFALLTTIIPAVILGGLFYYQNSKLLKEKLSHELHNATVQVSGKLGLWLNERQYDLRVFSSSYIILENLVQLDARQRTKFKATAAREHLKGYLQSVSDKFGIYDELAIVGPDGETAASDVENSSTAIIPDHWRDQLKNDMGAGRKPHLAPYMGPLFLHLAETVESPDGAFLGLLVAKIRLNTIRDLLSLQLAGGVDEIYLVDDRDRLLVSTQPPMPLSDMIDDDTNIHGVIQDHFLEFREYVGYHGVEVIGMATPIPSLNWLVVVEIETQHAYVDIAELRSLTIKVVSALILCIALAASLFGQSHVRPLRVLSKEASRVAAGNLDVDIPVEGRSEVSYLTQVFNHMVASLRQGREEISAVNDALTQTNKDLQQLSITDGLTGLYNRKHIMEIFEQALILARRYHRKLTLLMLDIDHFKTINDTFGHQAGDAVLHCLAENLSGLVRECDSIGRYGGEEFLIILPESDKSDGAITAERIRHQVSTMEMDTGMGKMPITISVGVAGYPADGQDITTLLSQADEALYKSKDDGRNKITVAGGIEPENTPKLKVIN